MTQTLPTILAALAAQRDILTVWNEAIEEGFSNPKRLYADTNAMDVFSAAHEQRTTALQPLNAWLDARVRAALAQAKANGRVYTLPKGISTPFVDRWNSMLVDRKPHAFVTDDVVGALVDVLRKAIGFNGGASVEPLDAATIESMLDAGTIEGTFHCDGDMLVDFWTGRSFVLSITGWQPTLYRRLGPNEPPKPAKPRDDTMIVHGAVEVPSGRLIVADRLPFDAVETVIENVGASFNVNYGMHRLLRSALLMGEQQVVQISVGNTSPSFCVENNTVLVGRSKNRPGNAQICTDLWMATAVDASVLHGMGVTEEEIAQAIADGSASEVQITPGTWHVFWSEDAAAETTAERFAPLYNHAKGDQLHVWMTQEPDAVLALETITVFDTRG